MLYSVVDWRKTVKLQAGSGVGEGEFPSQPRAGYACELLIRCHKLGWNW